MPFSTNLKSTAPWRIDLHVHTQRYSPCAESLNPSQIAPFALKRQLNGIVLTEHDLIWRRKETTELNRLLKGIRIYRGMEVSAREGHFVIIGMDRTHEIKPGINITDLIRIVHRQEAVVILVHPFMFYSNTPRPVAILDLPIDIDAIEVCSCVTVNGDTENAVSIARRRNWAMVGGSDAHCLDQIGQTCTGFDKLPEDEKELAHMIRNGCTEPIGL